MSTTNEHVGSLIDHLAALYKTVSKNSSPFRATAYANIIYGLQSCSCKHQGTASLLSMALEDVDALLQQPNLAALHEVVPTSDLLAMHQSLCLLQVAMPDLSACTEIEQQLEQQMSRTLALLAARKSARDLRLQSLTVPEARLSTTLQAIVANEPLVVSCGDLLHGFECAAILTLNPELKLTLHDETVWCPVLDVEVAGTRSTRPVRAHFDQLRRKYLMEKHGVNVETIGAEAFNVAPGFQRNLLRIHPNLLDCFRLQNEDDKAAVDAMLSTGSKPSGPLLSTVDEQATLIMTHASHPSLKTASQITNADMYVDDNLENSGVTASLGSNFAPRGVKINYGMYVGWVGPQLKCEVHVPNVPAMHPRLTNKTAVQQMTPTMPQQMPQMPQQRMHPGMGPGGPYEQQPPHAPQYKSSQSAYGGNGGSSYNVSGRDREREREQAYADRSDDQSYVSGGSDGRGEGARAPASQGGGEVDIEIALLERQLEIARMEAKILELKKSKMSEK